MPFAGVAELVDARDLGSRDESRGGSSPSARTTHRVEVTSGARRNAHHSNRSGAPRGLAKKKCVIDASYRNAVRRSQARIQGGRAGRRTRRQGQCAPGRVEGSRPHQRFPSRQSAGRPSQARLWPLGHGRGDRGDGARHQQPDRQRARFQARRRAEGDAAERGGGGRETDRRRERPRLHHGGRDRAADRARRFQDHQAHPADQRSDRRRAG